MKDVSYHAVEFRTMKVVTGQICPSCGAQLLATDRFCSGCGLRLGADVALGSVSDPLLERLRQLTLGYYDVHSELGRGGMAAVYLAHDLRLRRKVAIKVMLPELLLYGGMADRFLLEARIAAQLSHPNVISIHSVSNSADLYYFVMSLVDGVGADEIISTDAVLPVSEVQWMLSQAARALDYAHGEGVVHRDVKPANIMINMRGDAVLTDFGIAKASESPHLTRTGSALGTPTYMSPEQLTSGDVTGASDQYSLGVVAYEMLTGVVPFRGSIYEVQVAHALTPPPDIAKVAPSVPPELAAAVMRMLAKDPGDRWESLEHLVPVFTAGLAANGGRARDSLGARARAAQSLRTSVHAPTPHSPLPALSNLYLPPNVANEGAPGEPQTPVVLPPSGIPMGTAQDETLEIEVIEPPRQATHLVIQPAVVDIEVGDTVALTVTAEDETPGMSLPLPGTVQWRSDDEGVIACSPFGVLMAREPGRALVHAQADSLAGTCVVRVVPAVVVRLVAETESLSLVAGQAAQVGASAYDRRGNRVPDASLMFESMDEGIIRIDASGLAEAVSPGSATVRVQCGDLEATVPVTVIAVPIASIKVVSSSITLEVGDSWELNAVALDAAGAALMDRPLAWRTDHADVVRVTVGGLLTAVAPGRASVHVGSGEARASVEVAVLAVPLRELVIAPGAVATVVGRDVQLMVQATDVRGHPASVPEIVWTSDHPSVATVGQGQVHACAAGWTMVTARAGDITASVRVQVAAAVPTSLQINGPDTPVRKGGTGSLRAQVSDSEGFAIEGLPVVWASTAPDMATVDPLGLVHGMIPGNVGITATVGTLSTTRSVTILPARKSPLLLLAAGAVVAVILALGYTGLRSGTGGNATVPGDSTPGVSLVVPLPNPDTSSVVGGGATADTVASGTADSIVSAYSGAMIYVDRVPQRDTLVLTVGDNRLISAKATAENLPDSTLFPYSINSDIVQVQRNRLIAKQSGTTRIYADVLSYRKRLVVVVRPSEAVKIGPPPPTDVPVAPPPAPTSGLPHLTEQQAVDVVKELIKDHSSLLSLLTGKNAKDVRKKLADEFKKGNSLALKGGVDLADSTATVTYSTRDGIRFLEKVGVGVRDCNVTIKFNLVFSGPHVTSVTPGKPSDCK